MPTYAYECQACGHSFEKFQSMSARVLRTCPECHERKLERLIGPGAAILFKGSGFYETDYRSKSYQDGEKAAKSEPSKSGDSGSKDSGSKSSASKDSGSKSSASKDSAAKDSGSKTKSGPPSGGGDP